MILVIVPPQTVMFLFCHYLFASNRPPTTRDCLFVSLLRLWTLRAAGSRRVTFRVRSFTRTIALYLICYCPLFYYFSLSPSVFLHLNIECSLIKLMKIGIALSPNTIFSLLKSIVQCIHPFVLFCLPYHTRAISLRISFANTCNLFLLNRFFFTSFFFVSIYHTARTKYLCKIFFSRRFYTRSHNVPFRLLCVQAMPKCLLFMCLLCIGNTLMTCTDYAT